MRQVVLAMVCALMARMPMRLRDPAARLECPFSQPPARRSFTFSFVPVDTGSGPVLHITVQFQGISAGEEQLVVPDEWAGEKLHAVSNLRALSASTTIDTASQPGVKTVRYPPHSTVVLTYDLSKDWNGPLVHPFQFHPVIMPTYFEINGKNALIVPKLDPETPVAAHFDFHALPPKWTLATSFGATANRGAYCQSASGTRNDVLSRALFAAGDFRIHRFQIGRRPAVLAARGDWLFTDEQAIEEIQRTVGIVRDFWHDDSFPYFLVTLKPYDQDHGSSDGSAFTNAFWMYVSRLDSLDRVLPTLAHESFHAWDLGKMGPYESYADFNWFHEGFTQYYAYKLVYLAGLMPLATYIDNLNRDLRLYPGTADPYIRGRVIALWLDGEIRAESQGKKSLDNVMFDMVADHEQAITLTRILRTADRYLLPAAQSELEAAANKGVGLLPRADALPHCTALTVATKQLRLFDLGFDVRASERAGKIVGVEQGGPAYKAGMRDDEKLTSEDFYNRRPDSLAKFGVEVAGESKMIEYYPQGAVVSAPQYHVDSTALATQSNACGSEVQPY